MSYRSSYCIMDYLNVHTHHKAKDNKLQVFNVFAQVYESYFNDSMFSVGIHPWHLNGVNLEQCISNMGMAISDKNMVAIGECGIDRAIKTAFALQERYFRIQVNIAKIYSKPLIIHCVRAYHDLIRIKKDMKSDIPWIIHAFQADSHTTHQLIKHGFYFSIGENQLKTNQRQEIFKSIPIDRIFLETDDTHGNIEHLYKMAGNVLLMDKDDLAHQIIENFDVVFHPLKKNN